VKQPAAARFFRITQLVTKVPTSTDFRLAPLGSPWLTLVIAEKRPRAERLLELRGAQAQGNPPRHTRRCALSNRKHTLRTSALAVKACDGPTGRNHESQRERRGST